MTSCSVPLPPTTTTTTPTPTPTPIIVHDLFYTPHPSSSLDHTLPSPPVSPKTIVHPLTAPTCPSSPDSLYAQPTQPTHPSINSLRRLSRKLPPAWTESLENLAKATPPPLPSTAEHSAPHIAITPVGSSSSSGNSRLSPLSQLSASNRHVLDVAPLASSCSSDTRTAPHWSESGVLLGPTHLTPSVSRPSLASCSSSGFGSFPWSSLKEARKPLSVRSNSSPSSFLPTSQAHTHLLPQMSSQPIPPRKHSSPSSEILVTPHSSVSRFNMFSLSPLGRPRGSVSSSATGTTSTSALSGSSAARTSLSASSASRYAPSCTSRSGSVCGMTTTWSIADELDMVESSSSAANSKGHQRSSTVKAESRRQRKERMQREKEEFDPDHLPDAKALFQAGLQEVIDENGKRIKFAELVKRRRTIVVFIRHWFCPLCAQYMNSILADVSLDALEEANVDLVIIGNGSDKMLDGYRNKAFRCPFKMYTDPSLALYRALGLTRQTGDAGPEEDKGDYLVQSSLESTVQTIKRATKMPIRNPGHFFQLGGEFVFDTPSHVSFAHRMINTRSHLPIRDICAEAGVRLRFIHYEPGPPPPPVHRQSYLSQISAANANAVEDDASESTASNMTIYPSHLHHSIYSSSTSTSTPGVSNDWQKDRDDTLSRMKALRAARRGGFKNLSFTSALESFALDGQGLPGDIIGRAEWKDPRQHVQIDQVRIVGRDIGEEEVVLDPSVGALGYQL